ncbi:glycosyltransferase [Tunicatimonas pelagia]|uniref:glycosyltransferase n=1 Tax=Tunicatimonas pelagia TaxID=931531 RepID=UPI002665995A|nr:glycosyltransferase [Tunicatimonas pelagia]WKN44449.1 glycosyltransferase [Tunicatimonas pelagia]
MNTVNGVSVIVCCYNSASRLPQTLKHIAQQKVSNNTSWEVIVVDNASTDNTAGVASQLWQEYGQPTTLKIIYERQAGLSFARHAGFTSAKYEYCLFCDDDNWLGENYVASVFQIMEKDDRIGVLGGIGEAVCEIEPPEWFEAKQASYAVGSQSLAEGDITHSRGFVYGAASTYRKSVYWSLRKNGYEGFLTGRKGGKMTAGDDSELCYNYAIKGYKIYYSPRLKFKHFIPANRLTESYYQKMCEGFTNSRVVLTLYQYRLFQHQILSRKFLWLRETLNAFYYEFKSVGQFKLKETFAYALILNRSTFLRTLKYLKSV